MLKVVVLPALGTNRANIQVVDDDGSVIATLDVVEMLGNVTVTTRMYDGNAHTFQKSNVKEHIKDLEYYAESPEYSQEAAAATIDQMFTIPLIDRPER